MDTPDLYPLALLMDELKHEDIANRVTAMNKLDTIAIALGPQRTTLELLPFLSEVAQDDEEEVFAVLAQKLGHFLPYIQENSFSELVSILEILASMEEPIVRDKAVDSLNSIASSLSSSQLSEVFFPLISSLSTGNWFLKKVAATGLFKSVILLDPSLFSLYSKLVLDEYPMVRRAAASNLPELIKLSKKVESNLSLELTGSSLAGSQAPSDISSHSLSNTFPWETVTKMFHHIINDDQDSVKFLGVDVLIAILEVKSTRSESSGDVSDSVSSFLDSTLKLIKDDSWRVRYTAADRFAKIASNFNNEQDLLKLIDPFINLMNDNEGEVRKAIAKQLPSFCELLSNFNQTKSAILSKIIPIVDELSQDSQENVRASLASTITGLSPILERQSTIDKLLPLFLSMLRDDFPEVRLNIISNLSVVNETIGINLLSTNLLPAITELAQDHKWRVRLAIIEYIPKLANQLGVSFFNDELLSLCMSWLWDPVYAIREAAVNNLKQLTEIFGSDWAKANLINRLTNDVLEKDKIDYSNFIIRITCLFAISNLIPVIDHQTVIEQALPFINKLVTDDVPNIRFNVAKSYYTIVESLSKANQIDQSEISKLVETDLMKKLTTLQNDQDVDVRFFASKSIQQINGLFEIKQN